MSWQRFSKHYQTLAVVLLNTLLLLVVVLAALHFAFPLERSIWNQNLAGRQLSEDFVAEHYYLTSREETEEIRRAFDDYVLQGHWQVHPWTGLINRHHTSEHLNIDREGMRASHPPEAAGEREVFEVWAFGGSTLFGWGVSDDFTIPSQLQGALQRHLPGKSVRVRNFGVPWYNSSHETALLVANLRRSAAAPQAAVLLDGLNDLVHRLHYQTESPLHHQLERAWEARLDDLFAPPPWLRLASSFPLFRAAQSLRQPETTTLGGLGAEQKTDDIEDLIRHAAASYAANRRTVSAACAAAGVTPYFFLQPVPIWLDDSRRTTTDSNYDAFAEQVLRQADPRLVDLRGGLSALEPEYAMTVERVGVHYSDIASRVLAEAMAAVIASDFARTDAGQDASVQESDLQGPLEGAMGVAEHELDLEHASRTP